MLLETGITFKDPKTDFTWKISNPWMSRWKKRQVGWICKKVGRHPEQCLVSNWFEHEIVNLLNQAKSTKQSA